MAIELDKNQFEFIKPLSWKEAFGIWRENEANEEHWVGYYKKKGFESWEDWRKQYVEPIRALNKEWRLVKVVDPLKSVPNFHGGPFNGWSKNFYEGRDLPTFAEMKENPAAARYLENFPGATTIIAWNTEIGVVIIEGMHRCAAITKAAKEGEDLELILYIAISDCPRSEIPDFREEKK
ncbi:MAG: hypothetical protein WD898_02105 [Candidatus Paceibacterota bacterium]